MQNLLILTIGVHVKTFLLELFFRSFDKIQTAKIHKNTHTSTKLNHQSKIVKFK